MTTLVTALSEAVSTHPEGVALLYGDQQLKFTELDEISDGLARALVTRGIEPGDRIAVLDRNSLWFFVILFAVMKARAVLVTVNFRLAPPEVDFILRDSGSKLLFVGERFDHSLTDATRGYCDIWLVETLERAMRAASSASRNLRLARWNSSV